MPRNRVFNSSLFKGVKCYIMYHDDILVSVAAIMDNSGVASLEFGCKRKTHEVGKSKYERL